MKKQYLAQVKFHKAWDNKWVNIRTFIEGGKRYYDTLEDAEKDLEAILKKFNDRKIGVETTYHAGFGIDTIVETRIRWREVTDWKEVE